MTTARPTCGPLYQTRVRPVRELDPAGPGPGTTQAGPVPKRARPVWVAGPARLTSLHKAELLGSGWQVGVRASLCLEEKVAKCKIHMLIRTLPLIRYL